MQPPRALGTLRLPEAPNNLGWGGRDARTLYVTALTSVYRIRLQIPGIRPNPAGPSSPEARLIYEDRRPSPRFR